MSHILLSSPLARPGIWTATAVLAVSLLGFACTAQALDPVGTLASQANASTADIAIAQNKLDAQILATEQAARTAATNLVQQAVKNAAAPTTVPKIESASPDAVGVAAQTLVTGMTAAGVQLTAAQQAAATTAVTKALLGQNGAISTAQLTTLASQAVTQATGVVVPTTWTTTSSAQAQQALTSLAQSAVTEQLMIALGGAQTRDAETVRTLLGNALRGSYPTADASAATLTAIVTDQVGTALGGLVNTAATLLNANFAVADLANAVATGISLANNPAIGQSLAAALTGQGANLSGYQQAIAQAGAAATTAVANGVQAVATNVAALANGAAGNITAAATAQAAAAAPAAAQAAAQAVQKTTNGVLFNLKREDPCVNGAAQICTDAMKEAFEVAYERGNAMEYPVGRIDVNIDEPCLEGGAARTCTDMFREALETARARGVEGEAPVGRIDVELRGTDDNMPFGGRVEGVEFCVCSENFIIEIGEPRGGEFMYQPDETELYPLGEILEEGVYALGTYGDPVECIQPWGPDGECIPVAEYPMMVMVGTSMP